MSEIAGSGVEDFQAVFRGSFTSAMRWHHLDALWQVLRDKVDDDWHIYAIGETPPESPVSHDQLLGFIDEVDRLLRTDHQEDYCGIVYADNLSSPRMVKIYDPNNLGVSCGFSENPPLPGWVLTKIPPVELESTQPATGSRRRWWRRLFP